MSRCSAILILFLSIVSMPFILAVGSYGVFDGSAGLTIVKTLFYRGLIATAIAVAFVSFQEGMFATLKHLSAARWFCGAVGLLALVVCVMAAAAQVVAGR